MAPISSAPIGQVRFQVQPTGKAKGDPANTFAAIITIGEVPQPGLYQVTLSGRGWIDLIQNGAPLKVAAHTGKSDCDGVRKSVRFKLSSGPLVIQLSDVPEPAITIAIRRAD